MRGEDRLSNLPLSIIENILCLVPIQEAGRTSILSREWRYRWTKIPKLVFEENTFHVSNDESSILEQNHLEPNKRETMDTKSKLIHAIDQVLLLHDGPIHEFTLYFLWSNQRVKIDPIIMHLSMKTSIKKLKLDFAYPGYRLPSSIFSFHELTDLCLIGGHFDHQLTFYEFGSLITSLILRKVSISATTLQQLLSSCPLLKTVFLDIPGSYICRSNRVLTFRELFDLFECLPVIETLSLSFQDFMNVFEDRVEGRVSRELPIPFFHLKYLEIYEFCFTRKEELILSFLFKNSPNLEKLKILDGAMSEVIKGSSSRVKCYPGIMLEHLKELEINDFKSNKTRLDFVKLILARSPSLKVVRIVPHPNYRRETLQFSEILLGFTRASPEVQIIVDDSCKYCSSSSAKQTSLCAC